MTLGSSLKIITPQDEQSIKHNLLENRQLPYQHPLQAIFRDTDGKDLNTIIQDLEASQSEVLWEKVIVATEGQREIQLTQFQYNMARDLLLVSLQGLDVYEGTDLDYVKTSPTSITFNRDLHQGDLVSVLVAGTLSAESFGDDIYNALNQFRQLVDTPKSYYGHGGKAVFVNPEETGLVYEPVHASYNYTTFEATYHIGTNQYVEGWIPFVHNGTIKSIKVNPAGAYVGEFYLSMWTKVNGDWLYYSGVITTILYDIMDIPFIDESTQDSVYIKLENKGPETDFTVKIFVLE